MATLKVVERNTFPHVMCPNCSRMYQTMDKDQAPMEIPQACRRCKCPMDADKAQAWMNDRAQQEHDQAITDAGQRLRGETPNRDEVVDGLLATIAGLTARLEALESRPRRGRRDAQEDGE